MGSAVISQHFPKVQLAGHELFSGLKWLSDSGLSANHGTRYLVCLRRTSRRFKIDLPRGLGVVITANALIGRLKQLHAGLKRNKPWCDSLDPKLLDVLENCHDEQRRDEGLNLHLFRTALTLTSLA